MAQGDAAGLAAYGMDQMTRQRIHRQVERIWWSGFWAGVCAGLATAIVLSALIAVVVLG